jgi:hypothetical protein
VAALDALVAEFHRRVGMSTHQIIAILALVLAVAVLLLALLQFV